VSRLKKWFSKEQVNQPEPIEQEHKQPQQIKMNKKTGLKSKVVKDLEHTFYRYLVSKSLLTPQETEVDSEMPDNRILLEIELGPALQRQADRQASQDLFLALQAQLFHAVEEQSENRLTHLTNEDIKRFAIADSLMDALNVLNTRAASISRIKPLVLKHTGLLLNMVSLLNRFDFGQKSSGKPLTLKDAELSLSFLGIDQLRLLLPYLIMHEALKDSGRKFNQPSRKLWQHLQITAESARVLAELDGELNADEVYMQTMFHEMGAIYTMHVVYDCFDEACRSFRTLAKESGASEISHQISEIRSAAPVLDKLLPLFAPSISFKLAEQYKLSHFSLSNSLNELATAMTFDELSPISRVIAQGRAYALFKQMFKAQLMSKEQASQYLKYHQLDADKIRVLNKVKFLTVPKIED